MDQIREAVIEDRQQVYGLISALEENEINRDEFSDVYISNLSNPSVYYFVYERDHTILGFVSLHMQKLLHHTGNISEIQEIIVDKSARGTGIGKLLFQKAQEISRKKGCRQMEVCCNQRRLSSHQFYRAQGMSCQHFKFCKRLENE